MWVDGNGQPRRTITQDGHTVTTDYTTTREGVIDVVRQCKAAHINTLVVDVKPFSGQTLYPSKVAPRMQEWKGRRVPDFDVLGGFRRGGPQSRASGRCVHQHPERRPQVFPGGPGYEHPEWQSIVYTVDRGLTAPLTGARLSVRVPGEPSDPALPQSWRTRARFLGSEPTSGLVGLESVDSKGGVVNGSALPASSSTLCWTETIGV